jgi:hypothetical protein
VFFSIYFIHEFQHHFYEKVMDCKEGDIPVGDAVKDWESYFSEQRDG